MPELIAYLLPNDWRISFPKEWSNECEQYPEGNQFLFYPKDDDLTFRITSFCVSNESKYAPIEVLCDVFQDKCKQLKKSKVIQLINCGFKIECFEGHIREGWKKVRWVSIGVMVEGFLLIVNVFATRRNSIEKNINYLNTICRV